MSSSNFDVIIVGAGAAGLTAAIGLARSGFAVALVEAAVYPGAENWSGCVYFCENLAHPDILGPEGIEELAWERRLVERGFFATDGHGLLGMTYRDPDAFRHCYTVLRPIYDYHLAQVALKHGVALLASTTVDSLIRDDGRVIGVCTQRGPLYADLVFLAEGDASHLVTREGYENFKEEGQAPKFLQGIKEVIELPPRVIEERFGVGPEQGVAYEMLLRNGVLRGKPVHLNAGGFVYTNRQSLSVGVVLPADNLHEHFEGDPNLVLEWFENLPALQPWLRDGKRLAFGAKLIRGGGAREIPTLIDDGLAIGGAASGVGVDFPYPNFTGPATAMGLLLVHAARRIRDDGARFTRDELRRHYLEPLQRTHYWRDVEFLRAWPDYVKTTHFFFDRSIDWTLGSAYLWTRAERGLVERWRDWQHYLQPVTDPDASPEIGADLKQLRKALHLDVLLQPPSLGHLLLNGTLNTARKLLGRPRAGLAPAGELRVHYSVAGGAEPSGLPPAFMRRWFEQLAPALARAARQVYANDTAPLATKLPSAVSLLQKHVTIGDLLRAVSLGSAIGLATVWRGGARLVKRCLGRPVALDGKAADTRRERALSPSYASAVDQAADMTALIPAADQKWESRLAQLGYDSVKSAHIHVFWPEAIQDKDDILGAGLLHVCPAHVYEARRGPNGQLQVVVNFENCIKCETCWRTSERVDWARDGQHRFLYAVHSPVVTKLRAAQEAVGLARPRAPRALDFWESYEAEWHELLSRPGSSVGDDTVAGVRELERLCTRLDAKLAEFDRVLANESRTLDGNRTDYLEMLARYALQLGRQIVTVARQERFTPSPSHQPLLTLATELQARLETRLERIEHHQRFTWAAADGRQARYHHLAGLRRFVVTINKHVPAPHSAEDASQRWLRAEASANAESQFQVSWRAQLDAVLEPNTWRELERHATLTAAQAIVVRDLLAQIPQVDSDKLEATLHPPARKWLLAELGRRDPSLAYRAASHLWARDLAGHFQLTDHAKRWTDGAEWGCFAALEGSPPKALLVPAGGANSLLILHANSLAAVSLNDRGGAGLRVEPLATLGLRGAGLASVALEGTLAAQEQTVVDREAVLRVWRILSAQDLCAIAYGMSDLLCRRAVEHATSRVQFPGLFHDEEARDTIGKFGAVKKMVAEIGVRRCLIETLQNNLAPTDFSPAAQERCGLVKAIGAELLGTAPGSVAYNAGQVFGGTGYSEDDVLSKYYRDASAWRFLGPDNVAVFARHGQMLLERFDPEVPVWSTLPCEAELFGEIEQRGGLSQPLAYLRERLERVDKQLRTWQASAANSDPHISETLGRLDGQILACKALFLRTHCRLEEGLSAELEASFTRVWLGELDLSIRHFGELLERARDRAQESAAASIIESSSEPPITAYAEFLKAARAYDSGDFLVQPADPVSPRYVPELLETDPGLASYQKRLCDLISSHFGARRDGLVYERYIERAHRPDESDLVFCRRHGFLRMPIAKDLGGEESSKVEYYLLTTNIHRLADGAVSLTIQVNSSLGTTPVLLAREKDLPKAQKDLAAFVADAALPTEIHSALEQLHELSATQGGPALAKSYGELQARIDKAILSRPVLRVLAHRFVGHWQDAGRAGKALDSTTMRRALSDAREAFQEACGKAPELLDEMGRRREASDLFLRWVASGQISAFALTEPSAGSDTARVETRARPRSVPVEALPDGRYRFIPAGAKEPRFLLDVRRLEFRRQDEADGAEVVALYRWSETTEPAPIRFDEYDYETDALEGQRYFEADGRRCHFTDVAQLRERGGRLWYDYWELTGAKMWITNGRMCGIMCLYAKAEEGVTGFIVDRHAEGLIVGKDEAKMGQRGSPTNELALQAVRVPRENVIGLEGRGQVNALETLNVGRAGLAMSAMAQMKRLTDWSREFAEAQLRDSNGTLPGPVTWRLAQLEEDRFIAEALAHDIIGRFEHKQTKSVRIESAIAKMLVSELLHKVIETAEEIHGLAGQTHAHLVEKRKRDARVLNIYEGTNEIQRFFILKDLAGDLIGRWPERTPTTLPDRELTQLELIKFRVRQRALPAFSMFGQQLWQDPNLQANCFLLSEAVAWVAAADSTLARVAWLKRYARTHGSDVAQRVELGQRAFYRCLGEIRSRLERFDVELEELRWWRHAPAVRAASLMFALSGDAALAEAPVSRITRPLSVLVVLDSLTPGVPEPRVVDGQLLEPYRILHDADRAALETALRLRDQAPTLVELQTVSVGPSATTQALRELLNLGIERVRLVVTPQQTVSSDRAAAALAAILSADQAFDLILSGAGAGDAAHGTLGCLAAEALGLPFVGRAAQLAVRHDGDDGLLLLSSADGRHQRVRSFPAAVGIEAGQTLRAFTIHGFLAGLSRTVEAHAWPASVTAPAVTLLAASQLASQESPARPPQPLAPHEASQLVLDTLGLATAGETSRGAAGSAHRVTVPIKEATEPFAVADGNGAAPAILAVLAVSADGRLLPTAKRTLDATRLVTPCVAGASGTAVLVLVPGAKEAQQQVLAELRDLGSFDVCLTAVDGAGAPDAIRCHVLAECWRHIRHVPTIVVGEPWTEAAFARLAGRSQLRDEVALRVCGLSRRQGGLVAETSQARGKIRAGQIIQPVAGRTCWLNLTAEVELGAIPSTKPDSGRVWRWSPRLEHLYGQRDMRRLLEEIKEDTGLVRLTDAEFILDVGFGVGNRDGYDAVIAPLERELRALGVRDLMIGGSRKVTEELRLLPADRQIGQSGVSVNPRLLLAIGISGAPQHLNYIGARATIIAFNHDPEAPLMTLNQRQPQPLVFPVIGDLFETVPAFIKCLHEEESELEPPPREAMLRG
jgi:electron transfer flavoprotein-quinone oxidoreductase